MSILLKVVLIGGGLALLGSILITYGIIAPGIFLLCFGIFLILAAPGFE